MTMQEEATAVETTNDAENPAKSDKRNLPLIARWTAVLLVSLTGATVFAHWVATSLTYQQVNQFVYPPLGVGVIFLILLFFWGFMEENISAGLAAVLLAITLSIVLAGALVNTNNPEIQARISATDQYVRTHDIPKNTFVWLDGNLYSFAYTPDGANHSTRCDLVLDRNQIPQVRCDAGA